MPPVFMVMIWCCSERTQIVITTAVPASVVGRRGLAAGDIVQA